MHSEITAPIVITTGEPAGIGPDILIQLAQEKLPVTPLVIGCPLLLKQRAKQLHLPLSLKLYEKGLFLPPHQPGTLWINPLPLNTAITPGTLSTHTACHVLEVLKHAALGCLNHEYSALVTGPVHKGILNDAGFSFSGQTGYLGACCQTESPVMMLHNAKMRVVLATTHVPLSDVPKTLTSKTLEHTLRITHQALQHRFDIHRPTLLMAGLNPHAGEQGYLGHEEQTLLMPVIETLRQEGMRISDPMPADTMFLSPADAYITMYHDQGLPVLKYAGFHESINSTLGLPIIRTSVDHGTALALAGTQKASCLSLKAALSSAHQQAKNLHQHASL